MKLFISYAREDSDAVTNIGRILDDLGIEYFLDVKDLNWGDNILSEIHGGLRNCSHLILVLSPASIKSQWAAYETGNATGHGKVVLPFLTHPSIEIPGFLRHLHYESKLEELRSFLEREKGVGIETTLFLQRILTRGTWRLIFNPPNKSKPIRFGADERITAGQNKNEHWWRIVNDKLEIMQADGRIHSRFAYNQTEKKFFHTNDPDTSSIQNQILEPMV